MVKVKKQSKRANGEGHIKQRNDGRWERRITITDPSTGENKTKSFYGKTQAEALEKSKRYEAEVLLGQHIESQSITVGEWLKLWLESYKSSTVSQKTYDDYERLMNNHLIPSLGKIKLQDLKTTHIMRMYSNKMKDGGRLDGKPGGLGPTSIKRMHIVLKMALNKAVDEDIILKNPANACNLPRKPKSDPPVVSSADYHKLINYDSGHRYSLAFNVLLASGLRAGELRALTWDNVDFTNSSIKVTHSYTNFKNRDENAETNYIDLLKSPKTEESKRTIYLPKELMDKLKDHRKTQLEEILYMGSQYKKNNLVFCTRFGTPIGLRNLEKYWANFLKSADVDHIKLHGTRHTFATYLLESNVPRDTVKKILGHSENSNTIDIYSHPSDESIINASKKIGELLKDDSKVKEETSKYEAIPIFLEKVI